MNTKHTRIAGSLAVCLGLWAAPQAGMATEGYFALGFGPAQRGVAGAGVAHSQDAMSASVNPAAAASVGRELTFGLQVFAPGRGYTGDSTVFAAPGHITSNKPVFFVPNVAYNLPLANGAVVNFAAYGNGGMNTSYGAVENAANCGGGAGVFCAGPAGVDLTQLFVSATYAQKIGRFSYGIAPTLAVQAFEAKGLDAFWSMSDDATALTGNGHDFSTGVGLRVGMQYELTSQLTVGVSGQTKFDMSKFDKYAGLFEGQGDFDIPASATVGIAYAPREDLVLMLDYQRIFYSDVPAVANSMFAGNLGADGGAGFGWDDVDVIRIGAEWQSSPGMTWRMGYAHATNPVGTDDVTFGILAPGIVTDHFTLGGSRQINARDRIDFAVAYVPKNTVTGTEMTPGGPGGTVTLEMDQLSVSLGWTREF